MPETPKHRIVLSGPGLIGTVHADLVDASDRSELVGIVAPIQEPNIAFAHRRGLRLFDSIEAAVTETHADAAIIASPNRAHADQATWCIEHRVPVLVEKPLTSDLATAAVICRLSESLDVPVLVGHHRTYSPLLTKANEIIRSERFGALVAVQGSAMFRKPDHYFVEGPWRAQPGGGPVMINLIHEIGIIRFLCGPIRSVQATASNVRRSFEVEDTVALTFTFANGALGTFLLSDIAASDRSWEMTSGENPAFPYSSQTTCYHFSGTRGSLDFPTMLFRYYDSEPSWWTQFQSISIPVERSDPLAKQLFHFEDVIERLAKPLVSAKDGYENMLVLEAIRSAVSTNGKVDVEGTKP